MKKFVLIACILFPLTHNIAQEVIYRGYGNVGRIYDVPNFNGMNVETKGSRFFNNENYVQGELTTPDSVYKKDLTYRYDQILRVLQIKFPTGKDILLDPRDVVSFKLFIDNKTFLFERTKMPNGSYEILQVIYSSPTLRLLRDARKTTKRVNTFDPYTSAPTGRYDQIENDYRYYLVHDNMEILRRIDVTRKAFANTFPQKASKISQLFNLKEYRNDLTVSKLSELMRQLDDILKEPNDYVR